MAYCTQLDVQLASGGLDRLIQLSDQTNAGVVGEDIVAAAIAEASTWMNGYLRRIYAAVPFPDGQVPPFVTALCSKEAVFVMKQWRQTVTEQDVMLHQERERELQRADAGHIMVQEERYPVDGGGGTPGAFRFRSECRGSPPANSLDLFNDGEDW